MRTKSRDLGNVTEAKRYGTEKKFMSMVISVQAIHNCTCFVVHNTFHVFLTFTVFIGDFKY